MMNELAREISRKAGITEEQAIKAAETVSDYLKSKTPPLMHEQIEVILNGGTLSDAFKKKFETLRDDLEASVKNLAKKADELASELKTKLQKEK
jgi:hypothetical protein